MFENQSSNYRQILEKEQGKASEKNAALSFAEIFEQSVSLPVLPFALNDKQTGREKEREKERESEAEKFKVSENDSLPKIEGKVSDITGRGITDSFGVTSTDLGASILGSDGKLISIFGDTFSGDRVGEGDWRSPVALVGSGDTNHRILYESAVGPDKNYAKQLIDYVHDNPSSGWSRGGISTIIPDDLLRIDDKLYFHGIVNRGFGNVIGTGIWQSDDNGESWKLACEFPADLNKGYSQCWSWDYNPDDGYVYIVSTGFQRDKGIILQRVLPENIDKPEKYSDWGYANGKWDWDQEATPITPPGERWGELSLRRLDSGQWLLGGFLASQYALGYRTIASPTSDLFNTPLQLPVVGVGWGDEDHAQNRVAQLYGGFVLPGSRLDDNGGVGIVVSQWNTKQGTPYKSMQFKVTLENTIGKPASQTIISDQKLEGRPAYDNEEYMRSRREMEAKRSKT